MLIFNHKYIESKKFIKISKIEDIKKTKPNDIVVLKGLKEPFDMAIYCHKNDIEYAIEINSLKEAIFANALGASFVICEFDLAKEAQALANEYLWDCKVLVKIKDEKSLEKVAKAFIDGVIFI
jgi:hypothetical protein